MRPGSAGGAHRRQSPDRRRASNGATTTPASTWRSGSPWVFELPVEAIFSRTEFGPLSTELYRTDRPPSTTGNGGGEPCLRPISIKQCPGFRTRGSSSRTNAGTGRGYRGGGRGKAADESLVIALGVDVRVHDRRRHRVPFRHGRRGRCCGCPRALLFFPLWTMLQIVSGRQGDAPRDALDEWEIQQRNSARSIGLTVTQLLTLVPALLPDLRRR